jgi:quinol-cytochrome oxidoreductase complex cytochrome b subunit
MPEIELRVAGSSNSQRDESPDIPLDDEKQINPSSTDPFAEWKPSKAEWLMIGCFMIVSLVVALDATILVPILPVRPLSYQS